MFGRAVIMFGVGFDSTVLKKEVAALQDFAPVTVGQTETATETLKTNYLKALLGVSVTSEDPQFTEEYKKALQNALAKAGVPSKQVLYKGAQLLKQAGDKTEQVICETLHSLEPYIDYIDVYSAFYRKEFISVFGQAQGQRLAPSTFIEKTQNSFGHICAWWYWKNFGSHEDRFQYQLDHFQGKITPAWREFEKTKSEISVYYSGSECNALISVADLILKLIELFHFGPIDYRSVIRPLEKRCITYSANSKIRSHDLARNDYLIQMSAPDKPLDINLNSYIKHPVYFVAWTPTQPRTTVKPSFEWSIFYRNVMQKTILDKGCMKQLDFDKDMTFWNERDFIVPIGKADEEHVADLMTFGYENMPRIQKLSNSKLG